MTIQTFTQMMHSTQPALKDTQSATTDSTTSENTNESTTFTDVSTGEQFSTFLTLLTAQIRNQDPLAPQDSTQFVEQLATFSGLEMQAKSQQTLERIAELLVAQQSAE